MSRDRKDRSTNWYMDRHGGALLRLAKLPPIVRWQAVHNVIGYPKQIPDGLLDVTFAGKTAPDPFLIEIETYPDQETLEQIRRDLAIVLLTRRVVPDILVVVLLPKGNLRIDPEQWVTSANGLTELRVKVRVINLWTVPAEELLATGDVGLIPWVPLAQFGGSPSDLMEECRERIEDQAAPEEVENLLAVTHTMAEARYNDIELLSLLRGGSMSFFKAIMQMPAGQRLLAEFERQADAKAERKLAVEAERKAVEAERKAVEAERKAEAKAKAESDEVARKYILSLLRARFGRVPKEFAARLRAIDDRKKLDDLHEAAATCADLKAFRKTMGET